VGILDGIGDLGIFVAAIFALVSAPGPVPGPPTSQVPALLKNKGSHNAFADYVNLGLEYGGGLT